MTNTFFFTEGQVFQTEQDAIDFLGDIKGKVESVSTQNDFDVFESRFLSSRSEGNDCSSSLLWAKLDA
jgi:hypothetical protein